MSLKTAPSVADSPSAPGSLRWGAVPWLRGLRVGLVALWWPRLCVPTVLPSVENGLLGRGLWDKPLPAKGARERRSTEARRTEKGGGKANQTQHRRKRSAEAEVVRTESRFYANQSQRAKPGELQGGEDRAVVQP